MLVPIISTMKRKKRFGVTLAPIVTRVRAAQLPEAIPNDERPIGAADEIVPRTAS
jgi:hypothetical protein